MQINEAKTALKESFDEKQGFRLIKDQMIQWRLQIKEFNKYIKTSIDGPFHYFTKFDLQGLESFIRDMGWFLDSKNCNILFLSSDSGRDILKPSAFELGAGNEQ